MYVCKSFITNFVAKTILSLINLYPEIVSVEATAAAVLIDNPGKSLILK